MYKHKKHQQEIGSKSRLLMEGQPHKRYHILTTNTISPLFVMNILLSNANPCCTKGLPNNQHISNHVTKKSLLLLMEYSNTYTRLECCCPFYFRLIWVSFLYFSVSVVLSTEYTQLSKKASDPIVNSTLSFPSDKNPSMYFHFKQ